MAQIVKTLSAVPATQVRSLGWEDPLEKGMAPHSSVLAWRSPWTEEPGGLQSMGVTEWTQLRDYVAMFLLCSQLCWLVPRLTLVDL